MSDAFDFADDLGPAKIIHVHEPTVGLRGILVVDNVATGPSIGGLRMASDVSLAECFRLARAMTMKNAAAGLPQLASDPAMQLAAEQLRSDLSEGQNHRIEGVPFFVLNGKLALSGAHPPEVLLNALDAAQRPL